MRLAITPPRSISPAKTTGTPAATAKPILAISRRRKLVSAGLPAPSTTTISASASSREKLSRTTGSRFSRSLKPEDSSCPTRCPRTMTCERRSVSGFNKTGFISTEGVTQAPRACKAWARPISPPTTAAALFDIFCGLKGRTTSPRRTKARHNPATMWDLPTFEPVPCIIMAALRDMAFSRFKRAQYRQRETASKGADNRISSPPPHRRPPPHVD